MNIENLVFQGGGVKGIAYAGAIAALNEKDILSNIKRVAGTSAGSIIAGLVALGYDASEIKTVVSNTNFADFEDKKRYLRILTTYGIYKGDAFLEWMLDKIRQKLGDGNATFEDLQKTSSTELRVFATDLNRKDIQEFSFRETPSVSIAEAIRASMSIPIFFQAWQFPDSIPNNHIYVDGGTVYNYPLSTFDIDGPNKQSLGFILQNLNGHPIHDSLEFKHLGEYVKDLFDTLLRGQVLVFERDPEIMERTVKIDDYGISATDFNLTKAQQTQLFDSGYKYVMEYLGG